MSARRLRQAVLRLSRRLQAERSARGMALAKISVLGHLARRGPLTPTQLAAADRLRPQSLTRLLGDLEAGGLVRRIPDPSDGRRHRLELTAVGVHALESDMAERDAWLAEAMETDLAPLERGLLALAAELLERLADRPGQPPGGWGRGPAPG